jgi:hypothetical protein
MDGRSALADRGSQERPGFVRTGIVGPESRSQGMKIKVATIEAQREPSQIVVIIRQSSSVGESRLGCNILDL